MSLPPIQNLRKARNALKMTQARHATDLLNGIYGNDYPCMSLMLVGIKDLTQINERFGRKVGDGVIRRVGNQILKFAHEQDHDISKVSRMAGRDFLIIFDRSLSIKQIEIYAKKILELISINFGDADVPLHISPRIGIAIQAANENGLELLHRAKSALSVAYSRKGKRISIAEFQQSTDLQFKNEVDTCLRDALAKRRITILLQPQFDVATGRLIGAEALARMQSKELGEIGAAHLFAAADRCDLREELSELIQLEALSIGASWPAGLNDLRLAVNLGAGELDDGYSARLFEWLSQTGFDAHRLTLELTEENLIRDIDLASAQLTNLRAHKIQIAVDDFGTGYSSLTYLKALPLDYLKIDKSMTPDINGTAKDRIVLRAIIAMAKALELKIIAEGVEHEAELEMLKLEGCDYFQGYLRSKPLSADAFERFALRSN
jgi:diguanylate cyclase